MIKDELIRYSRHFTLPHVGTSGQQKLKSARVLCVGAGGLGSPLLLYLAAAGVGTLGIVDDDSVDLSNLQRQILYTVNDIKKKKTAAAKTKLIDLNPHINIITHDERLNRQNALNIIQHYDVIADGTDNFSTRYLINDACFHLKKPHVYASIFQFEGQCSVFTAQNGPCYRCLYDSPPLADSIPNCAESGVLGILPGVIGTIQATEVIKLILKIGDPLIGRLLTFNALSMRFQEFVIEKHPDCRLCVHQQPYDDLPEYTLQHCDADEISVTQVAELYSKKIDFLLLDVRDPHEHTAHNLHSQLIPLSELHDRLGELDKNKFYVVYCQSGSRSKQAVKILQNAGFTAVKSLTGGIKAWDQG